MDWEFIVALIVAIPIILLPVAFVWYLNLGGLVSAIRAVWKKRAAQQKGGAADIQAHDDSVTGTQHRG